MVTQRCKRDTLNQHASNEGGNNREERDISIPREAIIDNESSPCREPSSLPSQGPEKRRTYIHTQANKKQKKSIELQRAPKQEIEREMGPEERRECLRK